MATSDSSIRQFQVEVPEAELTELRRRINATRWPERETVTDDSQGVRLAMMQELVRYWGTDHDWRKCEANLTGLVTQVLQGTLDSTWEQPDLFSAEMRAAFKSLR